MRAEPNDASLATEANGGTPCHRIHRKAPKNTGTTQCDANCYTDGAKRQRMLRDELAVVGVNQTPLERLGIEVEQEADFNRCGAKIVEKLRLE